MGLNILLYAPNIIGYVRLLLLLVSWIEYYSNPWISIVMYSISSSLDALDGYVARKLNQTSAFGAWFDVVIDILGRGMLWSRLYHFGSLVAALEWLTFVCTHTLGANWKSSFIKTPIFVNRVMANNFKTPAGFVAVGSLQILPVWLYAHYNGLLTELWIPYAMQYVGIGMLAAGRALCAMVELWCIQSHILYLLSDEANHPASTASPPKEHNEGLKD